MAEKHILKNLHNLIRNSALTYFNEFVWQDIKLTNEFKTLYSDYLNRGKYDIEFLESTAVITTPSSKYIYVPNQWFVIAAYAVDVYEELQRYKDFFKKVSGMLNERPDDLARQLRDNATPKDKQVFTDCSTRIFSSFCSDQDMISEAVSRLWRFVNDYSWWSGQKTIDRGDFYVSVILNMLNLVNVSQAYVAEIVGVYANDAKLRNLVRNIDGFTIDMEGVEQSDREAYILPDEEIRNAQNVSEKIEEYQAIPKPEKVRIKISGENTLKEIKFKE